ncbi:hypothetical protein HK104_000222 [Borealophlyctis nickersoniae]|nr:hypothetical protein HK104_000222 [Borealophlyctis nickersoniae]
MQQPFSIKLAILTETDDPYMADTNEIIEANDDATMVQPKKKHVSEQAKKVMLENLAKAREVKAKMKNVNKYPKEKRARAEEMNAQLLEDLAKQKALELIEKERQEKELEDFRRWKEEGKLNEDTAIKATKATKPKAKKPASSAPKKPPTVKNVAKRLSKKTVQPVYDEEPEQFSSPFTNQIFPSFNIDDFLD